jgi:hypothetical protein
VSTRTRRLGWLVVAALLATSYVTSPRRTGAAAPDADVDGLPALVGRLLGPLRSLAAGLQWVRVQSARLAGEHEVALARAETALALDPGAAEGWRIVATHLALDLGSREREPDPRRRAELLRAGLATLERGERVARDPANLALWRGILLVTHAEVSAASGEDAALPWPGGVAGMWHDAAAAFERAVELGIDDARELADSSRARAAERAGS